jgi:hypothetical protein
MTFRFSSNPIVNKSLLFLSQGYWAGVNWGNKNEKAKYEKKDFAKGLALTLLAYPFIQAGSIGVCKRLMPSMGINGLLFMNCFVTALL